ncbi:MAG: hypothetical protein ACXVCY_06295 [Pseudobdellovibrionaceae bacterium]
MRNKFFVSLMIVSTSLLSQPSFADCFLGVCGGGTIIETSNWDYSGDIHHTGQNVADFVTLGQTGRDRDEAAKQAAANLANQQATDQRILEAQREQYLIQIIQQNQIAASNYQLLYTQIKKQQAAAGRIQELVKSVANGYEDIEAVAQKLEENNIDEKELFDDAEKDFKLLNQAADAIDSDLKSNSSFENNSGEENNITTLRARSFFNHLLARAQQYNISSSEYLRIMLNKEVDDAKNPKREYKSLIKNLLISIADFNESLDEMLIQVRNNFKVVKNNIKAAQDQLNASSSDNARAIPPPRAPDSEGKRIR